MRKITMWMTATLVVVAMATYYQVSLSGDGKSDDRPPAEQTDDARPGGTPDEHVDK